MPMQTVLTFVIILGVPLWLVAEELLHRFGDKDSGLKAVEPRVAGASTTGEPRRPLETSSHVA